MFKFLDLEIFGFKNFQISNFSNKKLSNNASQPETRESNSALNKEKGQQNGNTFVKIMFSMKMMLELRQKFQH